MIHGCPTRPDSFNPRHGPLGNRFGKVRCHGHRLLTSFNLQVLSEQSSELVHFDKPRLVFVRLSLSDENGWDEQVGKETRWGEVGLYRNAYRDDVKTWQDGDRD